jgi:endonuclease/exonuclease/phosphatase family metal-dependent hydrolase
MRTGTYSKRAGVLIRSWNVYHGRSHPAGRRGYLRAAIELGTADEPDVLCLQELPLWSQRRLGSWSGMQALFARTKRAPFGARAGRTVTAAHHGLLRSAFSGQANAILVRPDHRVEDLGSIVISDRRHHPRVCQAARVDERLVVANVHASGDVAQRQVNRALAWIEDNVHHEPVVLAGDFNASLTLPGFSSPHGGIDDILVRGAEATPLQVWPVERRRQNGVVLSDHAPVELTVRL